MLNKLRVRAQSESGFTLVELLVVMLILGLLAAIAIPAFFNQRTKAQDAEAKTQAKTAQTAIETYATDNNADYSGAGLDDLWEIEPTLPSASGGGGTYSLTVAADSYTITALSDSDNTFSITRNANGSLTYDCDDQGTGGCPDGGDWG
jgi:type IV pilus assembly protein PilA